MWKLARTFEGAALLVISIFSFGFTLYSFLAPLFGWTTLSNNVAPLLLAILGILSLLGFHLALHSAAQAKHQDGMEELINRAILGVKGVAIREFGSGDEIDSYLAKRISEAESEVCDLTWKRKVSGGYSLKARKAAQRKYISSIKKRSEEITYREVFIFNDVRRYDKLKTHIKANKSGYQARYFPTGTGIPRVQFVIIDKEEVIFASSSYPRMCALKHEALAQIFHSYFEEIWAAAIPIIGEREIDETVVEAIENELKDSGLLK